MPSLSFLHAVFLALVFVTSVNAAGPTPTSVEGSESYYGHGHRNNNNGRDNWRGDANGRWENGGNSNNGWQNVGNSNNQWQNGGNSNNGGQNGGNPNNGWQPQNGWNPNNGGGRPDKANNGNYPAPSQQARKRKVVRQTSSLSPSELAKAICPSELTACPIAQPGTLSAIPTSVSGWTEQGFECVDLNADLRACGGCPSLDSKYDCSSIEGADRIACVSGQCVVDSCHAGYALDSNKSTCQRK